MDNVHSLQSREAIMEEARQWVLTFNSDVPATDADIKALREWSARSSDHRAALQEAEDFWCEAEMLSMLAVPVQRQTGVGVGGLFSALFALLSPLRMASQIREVFEGRPNAVAAMLFLGVSIALSVLWLPGNGAVGNGLYATEVGEQRSLTLQDGSVVQLDTHSQVRIAYQDGVRQIHLLQGKAHFDVAKNADRPFEVYAREGLVRAVGTAFSVYLTARESEVEVIVDEGRVDLARYEEAAASLEGSERVSRPGSVVSDISLVPDRRQVFLSLDRGQGARFDRMAQVLAQLDDKALAKELAWRDGVLVFERDSLSRVVAEISRYTQTRIEIVDPALGALVLGGRFRVGELEALFEVLAKSFDVEVSYLNNGHVQLSMSSQ